jgi:hypothetical protein
MNEKSAKYTRRHFRDIAGIISQINPVAKRKAEAEKWAKIFAADNPRFLKAKFMEACGL